MTKLTPFNSFIKVILIWSAPWVVAAYVLGLGEQLWFVLGAALLGFVIYAILSKWICLWSLGNTRELSSPVAQRVLGKVELLEIQSPRRAVFLFKGFPWETGIIAISTGELARTKESDLMRMIARSEESLKTFDAYIWTWVFPAYRFFSKSQEMLTGSIPARRLILGVIWYAPFQLCKALIRKHVFEFSSVNEVNEG